MNRILSVSSMMVCAAGSLVSLAALSGCQSAPEKTAFIDPPARSLRPGVPYRSASRPVSEPLQVGSERQTRRTELLSKSRLSTTNFNPEGVSPTMLDGGPGELIPVKIAANNQSSNEIFRIIFGEYLKMSYVVGPSASGAVTLDVEDEMTRGDLLDLAGGLCAIYGWTLEVRGDTAYIRPGDALARAEGPVMQQRAGLPSDQPVVRVRRMRHVAADQAQNGIKDLMTTGSKLVAVGRTLIIADTAKQANRVAQVLALLDVPAFDGSEIWTYRLGSRRPEEAKKILGEIVTGAGINAQNDAQVAFVEITGTDRLMVISKDPTLQPVLREYVELVDQPPELTKRTRFIYRIQHFEPPALQTFLKSTFAERMEPEAQAGASAGANAGDTRVRLVLDKEEQLLMIYATPEDYADIMATLRAVDRSRQQVQISSMIAEVGLNGRLEYGVEYFLRALDADGIGIGEITGTPGLPAGATLGAFFTAGDGFAVLRALQTESNVNLMSLPQLTIRDSGKGSIQVGGEVPIVKADIDSSTQNQGTTGIRRSIEYRKTGVILDIEPSINESGHVTLKLTQEVTAVGQQTDLGPEFTTRKIETTVTVPQGQTVLLGGIIDNQQRDSVSKIPIVGDIPLIGLAFQTQRKQDVRTELVLAITPTISDEPEQTAQGFSEFLSSASAVREALYHMASDLPRGALRFDGPGGPEGTVLPSIAPPRRPRNFRSRLSGPRRRRSRSRRRRARRRCRRERCMGERVVIQAERDGGGDVADQSIGQGTRHRGRGFTLLEAVLALGMLSAVLVVCLQLRTQTIAARRDAAVSAQHDRDVQAIVALITAGRLGQAVVDPETRVRSWVGEHDGRGYEVSAEPARVPNPMYGKASKELEPEVLVWNYEITFTGRATRFVWFR